MPPRIGAHQKSTRLKNTPQSRQPELQTEILVNQETKVKSKGHLFFERKEAIFHLAGFVTNDVGHFFVGPNNIQLFFLDGCSRIRVIPQHVSGGL